MGWNKGSVGCLLLFFVGVATMLVGRKLGF